MIEAQIYYTMDTVCQNKVIDVLTLRLQANFNNSVHTAL